MKRKQEGDDSHNDASTSRFFFYFIGSVLFCIVFLFFVVILLFSFIGVALFVARKFLHFYFALRSYVKFMFWGLLAEGWLPSLKQIKSERFKFVA